MNRLYTKSAAAAASGLLFAIVFAAGDAPAQARRAPAQPASSRDLVSIKRVEMSHVKTPDYNNSVNEANTVPGDWTKVMVRFDIEPDWTDQLEARFYVVVKHAKSGAYTMFTGSFVYSDIPKGRGRQVAVYLRPRTTERYGVPERAAVEFYLKGELVALGSFPEDNKQPWWRSAALRSIEGYLLDRSQTPYANIAFDNYEMPKSK